MPDLKEVSLTRLSICPCGYGTLHDEIQLGTRYTIDMATLRDDRAYRCGGCGGVFENVQAVKARQRDGTFAEIPYDLFTESEISK